MLVFLARTCARVDSVAVERSILIGELHSTGVVGPPLAISVCSLPALLGMTLTELVVITSCRLTTDLPLRV